MKETAQPKIDVRIPKINLRLEDVAYLRSLSSPQKIKCRPSWRFTWRIPSNRLDRLRVLGLIEDSEVPPFASVIAESDREIAIVKEDIRKHLDSDDIQGLLAKDFHYRLRKALDRKRPSIQVVITDLGRKLLSSGEVTVKMKKTGCL